MMSMDAKMNHRLRDAWVAQRLKDRHAEEQSTVERLIAENNALRAEREANLDSINVGNSIITRLSAEKDGLRAEAELWRKWVPYLDRLQRKPFKLAQDIAAYLKGRT